jgi:hypothetical protein
MPRRSPSIAIRGPRGLQRTVGEDDALRPIMACHGSTDHAPIACKGYLAREGWRNLNVRLLLCQDAIANPSAVAQACEVQGIALEASYAAVLAKLVASEGIDA